MGTTGSSDKIRINRELPDMISRIRAHTDAYLAVGFGVANRSHFEYVRDSGADGVVVGSKLVNVIKEAPSGQINEVVRTFCANITGFSSQSSITTKVGQTLGNAAENAASKINQGVKLLSSAAARVLPQLSSLPARFGEFGGQYVPEALVDCLVELEEAHKSASADPEFWKEFEGLYGYMNRPSKLYHADRLTEHAGGARIWFKREDLSVVLWLVIAGLCLLVLEITPVLTK